MYNTTSGVVSTLAGNGTAGIAAPATCFPDAVGTNAVLGGPKTTDWNPFTKELYIADSGNHAIRTLNMGTRMVTTIAGADRSSACASGLVNAVGTNARFNSPRGVAFDFCSGLYLYTGEFNGHVVRRVVLATRAVTLLAGSATGVPGSALGVGTSARFNELKGMGLDLNCANLYALDSGNHRVSVIALATATAGIFAGGPTTAGNADGVGTNAKLNNPSGLLVDQTRNRIVVGDFGIHRVRQIEMSTRMVSTIAGFTVGWVDGNVSVARLKGPKGVIVRATDGAIIISDSNNHILRVVSFDAKRPPAHTYHAPPQKKTNPNTSPPKP